MKHKSRVTFLAYIYFVIVRVYPIYSTQRWLMTIRRYTIWYLR